jgi:Flp pilus assembly protein TadG
MAIVLPILLLLMFATIDFGRMLNKQITVTAAAHEGARVLSLGGSEANAIQRAEAIAGDDITPGPTQLCDPATGATADAQLTITYDFDFITPVGLIGGGFDGKARLTGRGVTPCS